MRQDKLKRIFDFSLALTGIVISMPFWTLVGLLILIESKGPIFYIQDRVGKDGKLFKSFKFRSMVYDAENNLGPIQAPEDDERVTKLGKILRVTAMDELPQLFNILKAEMSFVGPRALRLIEIDVGEKKAKCVWDFDNFKQRCCVKPGLTGIAQVFTPRDLSRKEKFKYDLWYINNQSFLLDIYIIALSFLITFKGAWELRKDKLGFLTQCRSHLLNN